VYTWGLLMIKTNVKEARQKLSYLLDQVEHGEEVIISRRGHVIAHIIPHLQNKKIKKYLPSLKAMRNNIHTKGKPLSKVILEEREK
jgi:prevent-host-death family protein